MTSQLLLTLDGIRYDHEELPLDQLRSIDEILDKVATTLATFASSYSGHQAEHEHPGVWVRRYQRLQIRCSAPGYLSAQSAMLRSSDDQSEMDFDRPWTFEMLLTEPGRENQASDLPVQEFIDNILDALPVGVWLLLGDSEDPNRIAIGHADDAPKRVADRDETLVEDLHAIGLRSAPLFGPGLSAVDHGDLLYDERGLPK